MPPIAFATRSSDPTPLSGRISVPSDKSIVHRAILFSALADGESTIAVFNPGRDNLQSFRIVRQLGADAEARLSPAILQIAAKEGIGTGISAAAGEQCEFRIKGRGLSGLRAPGEALYCGNSGTTARLTTGILAGQPFSATVTGDASLSRRPFLRVVEPLSLMGTHFSGDSLPLTIVGSSLRGLDYVSPRASAQVKSAILLAGLLTDEAVSVTEPVRSRDHTERLFTAMGCPVREHWDSQHRWRVEHLAGRRALSPIHYRVPGDFSASAFFLVLASLVPGSDLTVEGVGCNPTRTGLLRLLERMGGSVEVKVRGDEGGETVGDLRARSAKLRGVAVSGAEVVETIDEIPILAVACALAEGKSEITGAHELRVKESDRLKMLATLLRDYGVEVTERPDGLAIEGNPGLIGCRKAVSGRPLSWDKSGDHRISMAAACLEYVVNGSFLLIDTDAVETSFPTFPQLFVDATADAGGCIAPHHNH